MKYVFLVLTLAIVVLAIIGCEVNHDKADEILTAEGCTETRLQGWTMFGCGKDDGQSMAFECIRNKTVVHGVICGGFMKGYTVRYK